MTSGVARPGLRVESGRVLIRARNGTGRGGESHRGPFREIVDLPPVYLQDRLPEEPLHLFEQQSLLTVQLAPLGLQLGPPDGSRNCATLLK
jgi:hypothetical protein